MNDDNRMLNKTMCRQDLFSDQARPYIDDLNNLVRLLYAQNLSMSSWVGTIPFTSNTQKIMTGNIFSEIKKILKPETIDLEDPKLDIGITQRLNYSPLPNAADDRRIPWFLYWEIFWVLHNARPYLHKDMKLLDAGGSSSLFTCYMASQGYEIHSVDLNEPLQINGQKIAQKMGWNMHSYTMNLRKLEFPDNYFDHAFSLCVFEHLDYDIKQAALSEISRCLKPGGILHITFDYRNPAPGVFGYGKDPRPRNALKTVADIHHNFLSSKNFTLIGNQTFQDNGESYLFNPKFTDTPYTFGAIFLKKKNG